MAFKLFSLFIAITVAILTTGFLRLQLLSGLPEIDGGFYTSAARHIYLSLTNGDPILSITLHLYQFMSSWVYSLEVNQYVLLRLIDGLIAIAASIILFKVILKESGSTVFTFILMTTLLIIMNDVEIILYGFRNSIWAAFLPLFSSLLIWQNSSKEDTYSFYLIGGLVSFGILLREPFLPFFIFAGIAILIGYGWRVLVKYLIGSAVSGFSILGFVLMFRNWDLIDLFNSYFFIGASIQNAGWKFPVHTIINANWFLICTASASILYLIKLYLDKKLINLNRFYFWGILVIIPLIEYWSKLGLEYHLANCLIGLAGLSALGWKYLSNNASIRVKRSSLIILSLTSMFIILPMVNNYIVKKDRIFTISEAIRWINTSDSFRSKNMVERSQYLKVASKVYGLSRENSTLAADGHWEAILSLANLSVPRSSVTGLTNYRLIALRTEYRASGYDKNKIVQLIKEYRPTIILTSGKNTVTWKGAEAIPEIIIATNLYERVGHVPQQFTYEDFYTTKVVQPGADPMGWIPATIWRLKDFK
ncbi:hypothetical protein OAI28_01115 [Methylophilaceae bacterium]|nr:hypothetical protein [Methylophilaceae bacterium]